MIQTAAPADTRRDAPPHQPPSETARRRGPGRPRRTDTEPRAFRSALELFGQKGWAGLSLDSVAQHAGVGKSSIYLRWKDKRDLLLDAIRDFESRRVTPADENLAVRDYLIVYARARGGLLLGVHGQTMLNIVSAAAANPEEFNEIREEAIDRGLLTLTGRLEKAVTDGELPAGADIARLIDALEGALIFHLLIAPGQAPNDELVVDLDRYVTDLVDMLLRGMSSST